MRSGFPVRIAECYHAENAELLGNIQQMCQIFFGLFSFGVVVQPGASVYVYPAGTQSPGFGRKLENGRRDGAIFAPQVGGLCVTHYNDGRWGVFDEGGAEVSHFGNTLQCFRIANDHKTGGSDIFRRGCRERIRKNGAKGLLFDGVIGKFPAAAPVFDQF